MAVDPAVNGMLAKDVGDGLSGRITTRNQSAMRRLQQGAIDAKDMALSILLCGTNRNAFPTIIIGHHRLAHTAWPPRAPQGPHPGSQGPWATPWNSKKSAAQRRVSIQNVCVEFFTKRSGAEWSEAVD